MDFKLFFLEARNIFENVTSEKAGLNEVKLQIFSFLKRFALVYPNSNSGPVSQVCHNQKDHDIT